MLSAALFSCLLFTATSCIHQGDLNLEPVPAFGFEYASNGLTLTFKPDITGVSDISWTTSDGGTGTGDSFVHTFTSPAIYWVSMKGTYNGVQQSCATKVLVAKAALVSMKDNSFDDWNKVTYPDFQFTGSGAGYLLSGKFDYDADYIYFFAEFSNTKSETFNAESTIIVFKLDSDVDKSTGTSTAGIGAEYEMEGSIAASAANYWCSFYNGSTGGWVAVTDTDWNNSVIVLGHKEVTATTTKLEWAYKRSNLGLSSNSFRFVMRFNDSGWSTKDLFYYGGSNKIVINMDKN